MKTLKLITLLLFITTITRAQIPPLQKANWIQPDFTQSGTERPPVIFQQTFTTKKNKTIKHATLYITPHGIYEAHIDQQRIGEEYFTPGHTAYQKRLQYQTGDITKYLNQTSTKVNMDLHVS